jgi:hypothetical protein
MVGSHGGQEITELMVGLHGGQEITELMVSLTKVSRSRRESAENVSLDLLIFL